MFVTVTGGSGSGKSAFAEEQILKFPNDPKGSICQVPAVRSNCFHTIHFSSTFPTGTVGNRDITVFCDTC